MVTATVKAQKAVQELVGLRTKARAKKVDQRGCRCCGCCRRCRGRLPSKAA